MSIFKKALDYLTGKKELLSVLEQQSTVIKLLKESVEAKQEIVKEEKPCKNKIIYNVNTGNVNVITCEGSNYSGYGISPETVELLKDAEDAIIIQLLSPKKEEVVINEDNIEKKEKELVSHFLDIFDGVDDFEVVGDSVYFKDIKSVEIPSVIVAAFLEILERNKYSTGNLEINEEYQSLKAFTFWLLLNPIESAREDALDFVRKNNIPITSNGMLVTFRKVVSKGKENKDLVKFISESYFKVKKWKKSPTNFKIVTISDSNNFELKPFEFNVTDTEYICLGDLNFLYKNLPTLEENIFTDNHTRTKSIKIGEVYKEDENKVDLDNKKDCSNGLHSGSLSFGSFNSFGDTGVVCLVNPMKIRSVPVSDCSKMRSSELFPVAIIDFEEYKKFVETSEINELSETYYNESLEFLENALKNKDFGSLTCQEELPQVSLKGIVDIAKILKSRVISI